MIRKPEKEAHCSEAKQEDNQRSSHLGYEVSSPLPHPDTSYEPSSAVGIGDARTEVTNGFSEMLDSRHHTIREVMRPRYSEPRHQCIEDTEKRLRS